MPSLLAHRYFVIPAQAGFRSRKIVRAPWMPACAGMTTGNQAQIATSRKPL